MQRERSSSTALVCGAPAGAGGLGGFAATVVRALAQEGTTLHVLGPPPADARLAPSRVSSGMYRRVPCSPPCNGGRPTAGSPAPSSSTRTSTSGSGPPRSWSTPRPRACMPSPRWRSSRSSGPGARACPACSTIPMATSPASATSMSARRGDRPAAPTSATPLPPPSAASSASTRSPAPSASPRPGPRESMVHRRVPAEKVAVIDHAHRPGALPPRIRAPPPRARCACASWLAGRAQGLPPPAARGIRRGGAGRVQLRIVGATGDRVSRQLFQRELQGLSGGGDAGRSAPGLRALGALRAATLEDGFGLVVGEAMASGLPVIVTDACGAAAWVEPGHTGWILPAASQDTLVATLEERSAVARNCRAWRAGARRRRRPRMAADPLARLPRGSRPSRPDRTASTAEPARVPSSLRAYSRRPRCFSWARASTVAREDHRPARTAPAPARDAPPGSVGPRATPPAPARP